jgi:simple sugar transport system permease protein
VSARRKGVISDFARTLGTVAVALLLGFIITLLVSKQPLEAYRAFLIGPLLRINRVGNWIEESITLTLVGLAVCMVFRARQFSLGAEGQLYLGALAAGLVGLYLDLPPLLHASLAVVAAAAAGFLWGLIPGVLKAYLDANEIVSSLMLNAIAIRLYNLILTSSRRTWATSSRTISSPPRFCRVSSPTHA